MLHIVYRTSNSEENGMAPRGYRNHDGIKFYTNPITERTPWYNKRVYFLSIIDEIPPDAKLTIVFDGDTDTTWFKFLKQYASNAVFITENLGSNPASLHKCYTIASLDKKSTAFYFLEDDYLHKTGWYFTLSQMLAYKEINMGIFSLYDHLDRYTRTDDITKGLEQIKVTSFLKDAIHIRSAEATTCTNAMRSEVFFKILPDLYRFGLSDRPLFRKLIKDNIRLWQSIPGYSTHDHIDFLSPGIDWEKVALTIKEKYKI